VPDSNILRFGAPGVLQLFAGDTELTPRFTYDSGLVMLDISRE